MPALAPRRLAAGFAAALAVLALTACVPEEAVGPGAQSSAPVPAESASAAPTEAAEQPEPSASASPQTALPASCADAFSASMRDALAAEVGPADDPGIELLSTQNATLLDLFAQLPTLRCTWGAPGGPGMSTNISVVSAEQAATVRETVTASGFGCADEAGATVCRVEQRGITLDDVPYVRGEIVAVRGDVWISTSWVDAQPEGYTEDILATLAE
jgi:hypothetical protein